MADYYYQNNNQLQQQLLQEQLRAQQLQNQLTQQSMPQAQEQARINMARTERAKDLSEGKQRGAELSSAYDEILSRRRQQADQGFTTQEMNAMREQNIGSMNQQNAAQNRAMRIQQAAQGVRGTQAIAQQGAAQKAQNANMVNAERDLFLKGIEEKRRGLDALTDVTGRKMQVQSTTELGYGALGAADRGAAMQAVVGQQQAEAARNSGGGGGGKK